VEGYQVPDPGAEESDDGRRGVLAVSGLVAGQQVVTDVVNEPGDLQLLVIGMALGKDRRNLQAMVEDVHRVA
jgi:hypothetical protein